MLENSSFAIDPAGTLSRVGMRVIAAGLGAIVAILALAAYLLFRNLPDTRAYEEGVVRLFAENANLTDQAELRLLEILAQSGTTFAEVLVSYRAIIFVLLVFSAALLVLALVLMAALWALNRRLVHLRRAGLQVASLVIARAERKVYLNDLELDLTQAALEALAALAEARMDGEILSGARLEALITGKPESDCDEAAGAMRIKRLRDALGNQLVSALLIKSLARQGYLLAVDPKAIRII